MLLPKSLTEKIKFVSEHQRDVSVCLIAFVLLGASLFFKYLTLMCLGFVGLVFFFSDNTRIFKYLFFLMPFAVIFKLNPSSTSLFTVLELFCVFLFFIRRPTFESKLGIIMGVLLAVSLPKSFSNLSELFKLVSGLLLFYSFTRDNKRATLNNYFPYFVSGLFLSALLGFFKERIPRLLSMYSDLNYNRINGVFVLRYSGLFQDPNYFSVPIIFCIICIGILLLSSSKKGKFIYSAVGLFLIFFGLLTYSKSFLLTLAVTLPLLAVQSGISKAIYITIAIVLAGVLIYVFDPGQLFTGIIFRFKTGDLTTGRTAIWENYFNVIFSSAGSLLFGHGLGSRLERAQHSIWIESLYTVGIPGTVAYFACLFRISKLGSIKIKRKFINFIGFIVIAVMFSFINGMSSFELPFYLMLSVLIFNHKIGDEGLVSDV